MKPFIFEGHAVSRISHIQEATHALPRFLKATGQSDRLGCSERIFTTVGVISTWISLALLFSTSPFPFPQWKVANRAQSWLAFLPFIYTYLAVYMWFSSLFFFLGSCIFRIAFHYFVNSFNFLLFSFLERVLQSALTIVKLHNFHR